MKLRHFTIATILCTLLCSTNTQASVFYVTSQQEFDAAHGNAAVNDSIVWPAGTYSNIYMDIEKDHLFITAETLGATIFTGASKVDIDGDYVTLQGVQYLNGDIGTDNVVNIRGSHVLFTQNNIAAYTCYKYLRVREESQYCDITYCNFENRLNMADQNILSLLVDGTNPGYHRVQWCSFKNFAGNGNDEGVEPIRIGVSTQADFNSRSLVEYCYFTQCNGDGEIISSKASQNVYRFNTFEDNPVAELVLRHGSESIVYGNFFLNGKGGVRVREGQNHYIYNNYFYEIDDRPIYLQNEASDPLDNINIAFNTIVDCSEVILGGSGSNKPTNVTLANNIFSDPDNSLFEEATGSETWIGNIYDGSLGIPVPASGTTNIDPALEQNSAGFWVLTQGSPAVNAAQPGYALLPQFAGMDAIDTDMLFDMMGQNRPALIAEKDLGCNEYPHNILVRPIATEGNTGPIYNMTTNVQHTSVAQHRIAISPNPVSEQLNISIHTMRTAHFEVAIFNLEGKKVGAFSKKSVPPGELRLSENVGALPVGIYTVRVSSRAVQGGSESIQVLRFVK